MKMPCFGYLDEQNEECQSFCVFRTECKSKRMDILTNILNLLKAQQNTTQLSQPIFEHFEKDFFSKIQSETREEFKNTISHILNDPSYQQTPQDPVEVYTAIFTKKEL